MVAITLIQGLTGFPVLDSGRFGAVFNPIRGPGPENWPSLLLADSTSCGFFFKKRKILRSFSLRISPSKYCLIREVFAQEISDR